VRVVSRSTRDPDAIADEPWVEHIQELAKHGLSRTSRHGPIDSLGVPRSQLPSFDDLQIVTAQLARLPLLDDEPVATEVIVGPRARRPLRLAMPLLVADMAFGSISAEAKLALSRGAEIAATGICTGEAGALAEEEAACSRILVQMGSARWEWDDRKLDRAQAFHVKLGQAAKTGAGGLLVGSKVVGRVAEVHGAAPGTTLVAPSRDPAWASEADHRAFVDRVRERGAGIPIGFKLSAQHIEDDIAAAVRIGVDYLQITDGDSAAEDTRCCIERSCSCSCSGCWRPARARTVGDVNRDGIPDILVGTQDDATIHVWLGTGGGRFRPGASYPMHDGAFGAIAFALADLDQDGKLDLVVASGDVIVRLGHGDGTFGDKISSPAGGTAVGVTVGDVSHDGELDAVGVYAVAAGARLGHGDGTFGPATTYATAPMPTPAVIADVSGDGKPDLIVGSVFTGNVGVLIGNGDGSFQQRVDHALPQVATGIAVGDIDRDGALDVVAVASNQEIFNASVLYGHNDGSFPREVAADLDHDGVLDLIVLTDSATESVLLGHGDGTFQPRIDLPAQDVSAIAAADLDGDGKADLVESHAGDAPFLRVQLGDGDGHFRPGADYLLVGLPGPLVLADLDGDGVRDVVVIAGDSVTVLLGNGDGTLHHKIDYPTGTIPPLLAVADLSGDGKPDLVLTGFDGIATNFVRVMLGAGDGTFTTRGDFTAACPGSLAVADITGDGMPDVLTCCFDANTLDVLAGNGDGSLQPRIEYGGASTLAAIAVADITGDGKPEVLLSGGSQFSTACLPSTATRATRHVTSSWPSAPASTSCTP
jgi:hypothetical protein